MSNNNNAQSSRQILFDFVVELCAFLLRNQDGLDEDRDQIFSRIEVESQKKAKIKRTKSLFSKRPSTTTLPKEELSAQYNATTNQQQAVHLAQNVNGNYVADVNDSVVSTSVTSNSYLDPSANNNGGSISASASASASRSNTVSIDGGQNRNVARCISDIVTSDMGPSDKANGAPEGSSNSQSITLTVTSTDGSNSNVPREEGSTKKSKNVLLAFFSKLKEKVTRRRSKVLKESPINSKATPESGAEEASDSPSSSRDKRSKTVHSMTRDNDTLGVSDEDLRAVIRDTIEFYTSRWRPHPRVFVLACMYLKQIFLLTKSHVYCRPGSPGSAAKEKPSKGKGKSSPTDSPNLSDTTESDAPKPVKNMSAKKHLCDKECMRKLSLKHFRFVFGACCMVASKIYEEKFWKNLDYWSRASDIADSIETFNTAERCLINCFLQFNLNYSESQYKEFIATHWDIIRSQQAPNRNSPTQSPIPNQHGNGTLSEPNGAYHLGLVQPSHTQGNGQITVINTGNAGMNPYQNNNNNNNHGQHNPPIVHQQDQSGKNKFSRTLSLVM